MKFSIIIPVFNEKETIKKIIERVFKTDCLGLEKEVIIINDGSFDGTQEILENLKRQFNFILINSDEDKKNHGKGAAIHTGLKYVSGDFILIQDADLEYSPKDYPVLLEPLINREASIVYGSRNLIRNPHFSIMYYFGGRFLSFIFNLLFGTKLTDINTGYKVFRIEIIKDVNLKEKDFAFCEEVTAKAIKKGYKIKEVPISYSPRNFKSGKKLKFHDGIIGLWTIIKYKFIKS